MSDPLRILDDIISSMEIPLIGKPPRLFTKEVPEEWEPPTVEEAEEEGIEVKEEDPQEHVRDESPDWFKEMVKEREVEVVETPPPIELNLEEVETAWGERRGRGAYGEKE